ncbi:MAG TPA: hypothetical protein VHE37_17355 [Nevskiaceae bacterium]|nr:hypothetical protein [Nevskiaceae bacterium]
MSITRRNHYDITGTVCVADPRDVGAACISLLRKLYPDADYAPVQHAFETFAELYTGTLPGFFGCETWYHDAQHSLDCALVMARLLDGYERSVADDAKLGERRLRLGVIAALFHDAGYIRRQRDAEQHGAEFTLYHVKRSGDFMATYLPNIGFAAEVPVVEQIVHYTGYEVALDKVVVADDRDRKLGFLLGSADVLAQMSDRCYLEKCRDFLYAEFEICGLAGLPRSSGPKPIYASPEDLLNKTAAFKDKIWEERMDGYFGSIYRYLEAHFGGKNPYIAAIDRHLARLYQVSRDGMMLEGLRRRAEAVNAVPLRHIMGLPPSSELVFGNWQPPPRNRKPALGVPETQRFMPT